MPICNTQNEFTIWWVLVQFCRCTQVQGTETKVWGCDVWLAAVAARCDVRHRIHRDQRSFPQSADVFWNVAEVKMIARRKGTRNLPNLRLYEEELLHKAQSDRRQAIGLLVFSLAFCALVFHAGLNEVWAHDKCGLSGGTNCSPISSSSQAIP
jgi:hypothetical protein